MIHTTQETKPQKEEMLIQFNYKLLCDVRHKIFLAAGIDFSLGLFFSREILFPSFDFRGIFMGVKTKQL